MIDIALNFSLLIRIDTVQNVYVVKSVCPYDLLTSYFGVLPNRVHRYNSGRTDYIKAVVIILSHYQYEVVCDINVSSARMLAVVWQTLAPTNSPC